MSGILLASTTAIEGPRERLLAAADVLMQRRSYEAVGVAELCEASGTRKGSFYYFFDSKQALAIEMLEMAWARTRTTIFAAAFDDDSLSTVEAFTAYAAWLADYQGRFAREEGLVPGCRFGNFAAELSGADESMRACIEAIFRDMAAVFEATIERGRARGEVPANIDARRVAGAVLAHMEGLMIVAKATREGVVLNDLGPFVAKLLEGEAAPTHRQSATSERVPKPRRQTKR